MIITTTQFTDVTNRHVLEVGPGLGSLTLGLVTACEKVTVIEIDPRLAARLPRTIAEFAPDYADRLTVSNRDALTVSPQDIDMSMPPTALVANLPYNVSVPILYTFSRNSPALRGLWSWCRRRLPTGWRPGPARKFMGFPASRPHFMGRCGGRERLVKMFFGLRRKIVFWPRVD